jgi:uncharacterized UBP type Zn finger protein
MGPSSCVTCELKQVQREAMTSSSSIPLVPADLLFALWSCCSHLAHYEQQDAHEFLVALIDSFDRHLSSYHGGAAITPVNGSGSLGDKGLLTLSSFFEGSMLSELTCTSCCHRYHMTNRLEINSSMFVTP